MHASQMLTQILPPLEAFPYMPPALHPRTQKSFPLPSLRINRVDLAQVSRQPALPSEAVRAFAGLADRMWTYPRLVVGVHVLSPFAGALEAGRGTVGPGAVVDT